MDGGRVGGKDGWMDGWGSAALLQMFEITAALRLEKEMAARGLNLRTSAVIVFGGEAPSLWLD